jgi:hypothetical protein
VAELSFAGGWHMLDGAYIDQFPRPDGTLASVDDLVAAVIGWLFQHPEIDAADHDALKRFMSGGGYKAGPPLLANCPYYDGDGLFPARVQGWADTMMDYSQPTAETEFGYTLGYRVNVQLRRGEQLTRNWFNVGHHLNDDLSLACESLTDVPGQGAMCYSPAYGDLAPGRVGNGSVTWRVPLDDGGYRDGALVADNLADAATSPRVRVDDPSQPGVLVLRLPSSYVYLGGSVTVTAHLGDGGRIVVAASRNQGLDWTDLATLTQTGKVTVDVSSLVRRQYDYRLRFSMAGAGTGLDAVVVQDEIQHSQRALPALAQGDNQLRFTAGPSEGTITLQGNTDGTTTKTLSWRDLHPTLTAMADAPLHPTASRGAITFPVATPGYLLRLRLSGFYRARSAADAWQYEVSFDNGQHFTTVTRAAGPTVGAENAVTFSDVPKGVRAALVRFSGTQADTLDLFDFRIDADYAEPLGGFAPVRVTYRWEEDGDDKSDVHDVRSTDERWVIHCAAPPKMKSLVVERLP